MTALSTPLVTPPSHPDVDDGPAIRERTDGTRCSDRAFLADPFPSADERQGHLAALAGMVLSHREDIRAAMSTDFASHPTLFTDLVEVLGVVAGRAAYAIEHLDAWMGEDERHTEPALYGTARAGIRPQPKGVIGSTVPWNFPFDLSVGPLVELLAAGNRVVIKPSDYTPACAELLQQMITATFSEDRVAVVAGGLTLAKELPTLRWDHLLYTGTSGLLGCTSTARTRRWPRTSCAARRPGAPASTSAPARAPGPRSGSAGWDRAATAGITGSRASASSPTARRRRPRDRDMIDAFLPPYGAAAQAIVDSVIGDGPQAPEATAPGSV